MTTSHAVAMMDQIERLHGAGAQVEVPMFLAHGAADRLCLPSGSSEFHQSLPGSIEASTAPRAELRIYPGNFHEIFNDVDQTTVFADVLDWMERCGKDARGASDREGSSHVR
jgi:alpha-beta hydrolase superfamily lysophospholipase